jgi:hypothetical protein
MKREERRRSRQDESIPELEWTLFPPLAGGTLRIRSTSCCGAFELAFLNGKYLVLRPLDEQGSYEETGRGRYDAAVAAYVALVRQHRQDHRRRGEAADFDPLVDGGV